MSMPARVVVAMSGGVDSSVAAYLLREQGYEVIGVGLKLPEVSENQGAGRACCGIAGMEDARRVAIQLGIPFYVLHYERAFDSMVIEPFCQAYAMGQTPNPCILCNARIKFGTLLSMALALGADYLATGHYALITEGSASTGHLLRKGLDRQRDQSYFLYVITPEQLAHLLFPLGHLHKSEVRHIARRAGLPVADKPGSQDICFLQGLSYREFLMRRWPAAFRPGPILDTHGALLGTHDGIAGFTVGQRKGLRMAAGRPLYVQAIDPDRNAIVVGSKGELLSRTLRVAHVNWLVEEKPMPGKRVLVKTRYRAPEVSATLFPGSNGDVVVHFDDPQPAAAPGQSAVFYEGDIVIGGGVIHRPLDTECDSHTMRLV